MRVEIRSFDGKIVRELDKGEVVVVVCDDGELALYPDEEWGGLYVQSNPAEGGALSLLRIAPVSGNAVRLYPERL